MRVLSAVLVLSSLAVGYALSGARVSAREDVSPARRFPAGIGVGSHVIFSYPNGEREINVDCTIAAIDAGWVRCATPDDPFKAKPYDLWYDLGHVVSVMRQER